MEYEKWRDDIFGQPVGSDPVMLDLLPETYSVSPDEHFAHIDRALSDPQIHELFNSDQIGTGLQLIYSNSCSDICFCYIKAGDEARRVSGIAKLNDLYAKYFDRYCLSPVGSIGNDHLNGGIGYLCYMLWDIFVLYPGNASPAMVSAALGVMSNALQMKNDNCIVSAIHGLGHWATDVPRAPQVLRQWLRKPTTTNPTVISYAKEATTGCVL
ncbi:MAG: hypothetical protein IPP12_01925 [Nitrospira sp.]|nr:hypothetical protein [Nitrospira sp.]